MVCITVSGNPFVGFTLFYSPALKPQKCIPMSLPTTAVVHNWRRLNNKSSLYPIYLRITIDRIQKYEMIPVPAKVSKEQWIGEDDNWIREDHPYFFEINTKIREQKQAIQNLIKRYYLAGKTMTFSIITSELKRSGYNKSFSGFFAEYVRRPTDNLEPATFKKYKACLEHLNSFKKDIPFQDLSPELIEEFYCYCRDVKL
jgi:hypothetical protein